MGEYVMYNDFSDPAQLVNLAGRVPFKQQSAQLREQLLDLIVESGDPKPDFIPSRIYLGSRNARPLWGFAIAAN